MGNLFFPSPFLFFPSPLFLDVTAFLMQQHGLQHHDLLQHRTLLSVDRKEIRHGTTLDEPNDFGGRMSRCREVFVPKSSGPWGSGWDNGHHYSEDHELSEDQTGGEVHFHVTCSECKPNFDKSNMGFARLEARPFSTPITEARDVGHGRACVVVGSEDFWSAAKWKWTILGIQYRI